MRRVASISNGNRKVTIHLDGSEYVCKLYTDGKHYEPADYFTDDQEDALQTANAMLEHKS